MFITYHLSPGRTTRRLASLAIALGVVAATLPLIISPTALAADPTVCFSVADAGDLLTTVDRDTGAQAPVGPVGVSAIEAIHYDLVNDILYATNAGTLGTLDKTTGAFTAVGPTGFADVDGLGFDPFTSVLYGAARIAGNDLLITIDRATGAGTAIGPVSGSLPDIDDLAVDPFDGTLYGVANNGGSGDRLVSINKATGAVISDIGTFGVADMEGLTVDILGQLRGTTGGAVGDATSNSYYSINKTTAAATLIAALPLGGDYESLSCVTASDPNAITGTVFFDANSDGNLDGGDTGTPGHLVRIYRDIDGDSTVSAPDIFLGTQATDPNGGYRFEFDSAGAYVLEVDTGTLPAGATLTTDNIEAADFGTSFGLTLGGRDFGYTAPASLAISKSSDVTGVVTPGDRITYTIVASNPSAAPQTNIVVTDALPAGTAWVSTSVTAPTSSNVEDDFESGGYSGSSGSTSWTTSWAEFNDDGKTNKGSVQVEGDSGSDAMRVGGDITAPAPYVERALNLNGATATTLSFTYRRESLEAGEYVDLEVWDGSSWQFIRRYQGAATDGTPIATAENISAYAHAGFKLRFIASTTMNQKNDRVYFDDVRITYGGSTTAPGGMPPNLVTATDGYDLAPGASMTITLVVDAADPLPVGQSHIENSASTTSDQQSFPTEDSVSDPIEAQAGDRVWLDLDGDGLQDAGEPGLGSIDVELRERGPDATFDTADDIVYPPTTTDTTGAYDFTGLPAGTYRVDIVDATLPSGVSLTGGTDPYVVTLSPGDDHDAADFGYRGGASIGDDVWLDVDGDGTHDAGEPGLPGVKLDLTDAGPDATFGTPDDVALPSVITDSTGGFDFNGLLAGTYRVDVDATTLPGSVSLTGGTDPYDVTIGASEDHNGADFGYQGVASIGDLLWNDLDGDGVRGGGEPGLGSVTVTLVEAGVDGLLGTGDDVTFPAMITDGSGAYDFVGLIAGTYRVDVTDATLPPSFVLTGGTDPYDAVLAATDDHNVADFGYWDPGSIGDLVFNDLNGNGVRDPGEPGLGAVTVELTTAGPDGLFGTPDDVTITDVTDASGNFLFGSLPGDTYLVSVDASTLPAGVDTASAPDPVSVILPAGGDNLGVDFAYWNPGSIGDLVWNDYDGDAVKDAGEPGLGAVTVELTTAGPDGLFGTADDVTITDATDASGIYLFTGLPPDTYQVTVDLATLPVGVDTASTPVPQVVVLVAGGDDLSADIGYRDTGTIGDLVFNDLNNNGVRDAGEPGLATVTVELTTAGPDGLFGTADDITVTDVTDGSGDYLFTGLVADTYQVSVDTSTLPPGVDTATTADPATVVLPAGGDDLTVDIGYWNPGSIGELVFNDLDNNGVRDAGEPGLAGVTIELTTAGPDGLFGTADDVTTTDVTDGSGNYLFTGLVADTYQVSVDTSTLPPGVDTATTADPATVVLPAGGDDPTVDIGYWNPGSIGELVFNDLNNNGTRDAGEPALAGVTVELTTDGPDGLFGTADDVTTTDVTDASGNYLFAGLVPDTYQVSIDTGTLPAGVDTATTTDPATVVLAAGGDDLTVDVGYWNPGSIGDLVFNDLNNNGTRDAGEPGLATVTIELTTAGPDGLFGTADDVTITDATVGSGNYLFTGLVGDTYQVSVETSTLPVGVDTATTADPATIVLPAGGDDLTVDVGYWNPGSIGDLVFNDLNGNGTRDAGEPGLATVTIELTTAGPDGLFGTADDVVTTDVTDASGNYLFAGLVPDTYQVSVDTGTLPTGVDTATTTDPATVVLGAGGDDLSVDVGYWNPGSIGDLVFNDLNDNGTRDAGEPGLGTVTVELTTAGPDGLFGTADDVVTTDVTNGSGGYLFTGLAPDTYQVSVDTSTLPPGVDTATTTDPVTVTLGTGGSDLTADFGYRNPGSIGDLVFNDLNGNGTREAGEPGLSGVAVTLIGSGADGVFGTPDDVSYPDAATDGSGSYLFTGLRPDTYRVAVDTGTLPVGVDTATGPDPVTLVLAAGDDDLTVDIGYWNPGSIGDLVFNDLNSNGTRDAGEPALATVTVELTTAGPDELFGTADDVVVTEVTDASGNYLFTGLAADTYQVSVDTGTLPAGVDTATTADPVTVLLLAGADDLSADFGYWNPGTIGDLVFNDLNNNGTRDAGEPGLSTVSVELTTTGPDGLFDTADDITITDVTDASGSYLFTGLIPDTYQVSVDTTTLPAGVDTATTTDPATVVLAAGGDDLTVDIGYRNPGSIGDLVFNDLDNNGVKDAGEPALPTVTVELTTAGPDGLFGTADDVVVTEVTDASGNYLFTGLIPDTYQVSVDTTTLPAGIDTASTADPATVVLAPGGDDLTVDIGYWNPGSIGDLVFNDLNSNGSRDAGEPGLATVTVELTTAGPDGLFGTGDDVTVADVSDASGDYLFTGLVTDTYQVSIDTGTLPAGVDTATTGDPVTVLLLAGGDDLSADFGYWNPSTIGDLVFNDLNNNGTRDAGEPGLATVTVELATAGPDGLFGTADDITITDVTDASGNYLFTGLVPDTYQVSIDTTTLPAGVNTATTADPATVVLAAGDDDLTVDIGYWNPGSIGDLVFNDLNSNGVKDAGEPALPTVTVQLTTAGPDGLFETGDDITVTDVTDVTGGYLFTGLAPDTYQVSVDIGTLPAGVDTATTADPATVVLAAGGDDLTVDVGYWNPGSIGDLLFNDLNSNGSRDAGEPGLATVTIELTTAGPDGLFGTGDDITVTDVTDGSGNYLFTGLIPDTYQVSVDTTTLPAGIDTATTTDPATIVLAAGGDDLTVDIGYWNPGSIGDLVFNDLNGNGTRDAGEPGLGTVTVELTTAGPDGLFGTADDITVTDVTDATGSYLFTGLVPDTYQVSVDTGTLPAGVDTATTADPATVVLAAGDDDLTVDIGYRNPGTIGDLVFNDLNSNGSRDAGEPGLATVTVELTATGPDGLFGTADDVVVTDVTDGSGSYLFTGLVADTYQVSVDTSTLPVGVDTASAADPLTVVLPDAGDDLSADFGYWNPGTIGDLVFNDLNNNSTRDAGEPGLATVTVELTIAGPDGLFGTADDITITDVTDASGNYLFTGLVPDTYQVSIDTTTLPAGIDTATTTDPATVVLAAGDDDLTVDIGYWNPGSIGDLVFNDLNSNGTRDAGEPALATVTVELTTAGPDELFGTADDVVVTEVTDASGNYLFTGLAADTYQVSVDTGTLPAGVDTATTADPVTVLLLAGADDLSADFGYWNPGTIGDLVFNDLNNNGTRDAGEPGLSTVSVELTTTGPDGLFDTADDITITDVTDASGSYLFTGLIPDTYQVSVDTTTLPAGVDTATTTDPATVVLAAGGDDLTVDIGYRNPGSIGDLVFNDLDNNGVKDAGEPALPTVTVELTTAGPDGLFGTADDVVVTEVTDASGNYLFTGLVPDTYQVSVDTTTLPAGIDTASTADPATVVLAPGGDDLTVDIGYWNPGSIGDLVFNDLNSNGSRDAGEPGLATVTVELTTAGPDGLFGTGDDVTVADVSDATGNYLFTGLVADTYQVSVDTGTLPPGVDTASTADPVTVVLGSGGDDVGADFGYWNPGSIGDLVFNDLNNNGALDAGEPALGTATVTLTEAGVDGVFGTPDDVAVTDVTDATGNYLFTGLVPDTYQVSVDTTTLPAGVDTASTAAPATVVLGAGSDDLTVDIGYWNPGSIGDLVFNDLNGNGFRDAGEPGLATVTVELTTAGPDGLFGTADDITITDVTDASGNYLFTGLIPDTYQVSVDTTTLPAGIDTATTTDPATIVLAAGGDDLDIDFGYWNPGSIGDLVFNDLNGNGTRDAGEPGLGTVTVELTTAGPDGLFGTADDITITDVTDASGNYLFTGLAPNTYQVSVDTTTLPAGVDTATTTDPATVVLGAGGDDLTADFGYWNPGTIGDLVFNDLNSNGTRDAREPGLATVTVELTTTGPDGLFGTADDITITDVTNASGGYLFTGLAPNTYQVSVDTTTLPPGIDTATTTDPATVVLGAGGDDLTADFGYWNPGTIGDLVFNDLNSNGTRDAGEPGLGAVTVELTTTGPDGLFGTADDITITDITDGSGNYLFIGLVPDTYQVSVDTSTLPAGVDTPTTADPATVVLGSGGDDLTVDIGYWNTSTIGDLVWNDLNNNGTRDAGEPGLTGVSVELTTTGPDGLFGTGDDVVTIDVADPSGNYLFTGLAPDTYQVSVDTATLPAGVDTATTPDPTTLVLAAGSDDLTADFGYWNHGTIGDLVFNDLNNNGTRDAGEPALGTVTVQLTTTGPDGLFGTADDITITDITDATGNYLFTGLVADTYQVSVDTTTLPPGVDTATTTDPATIVLGSGGDDLTADFGYWNPGTIGDLVFNDLSGNGSRDAGEPGLVGVTVELTTTGPDGLFGTADDITITEITDGSGNYLFTSLTPDTYQVSVDTTTLLPGIDTATTTDPATVLLGAGGDELTVDFGYWNPGTIGDLVFNDLDGNASPDAGEPALASVSVELTTAGPDGLFGTADDVTVTDVTDASGNYLFRGLIPDTYQVSVDTTTLPAGIDTATTPDPATIVLGPGGDDLTADFGYRNPSTLGDLVWNDLDGNGIRDTGEPGLATVTVELTTSGPDGLFGTGDDATTTDITDAAGSYLFTGLAPNTYRVSADPTTLPAGIDTATTTDPFTITLPAGSDDLTADFGYWNPGTIGDLVFNDLNNNGTRDPGEPAIAGVTVELTTSGPDGLFGTGDDVTTTDITDATGNYLFTGLAPDTYQVSVDTTTLSAGIDTATTPDLATIVLGPGGDDLTADFGYWNPGSIGDLVWNDLDNDGARQAGEPGLRTVSVDLVTPGPDAVFGTDDDATTTTTTDAAGNYLFDGLAPDSYQVSVDATTLPPGVDKPTTADPVTIALAAGGDDLSADFGYWNPGSIGDQIWNDLDGDGARQAGEPGIATVTVVLVTSGPDNAFGTPDDVTTTTVTDGLGAYLFDDLPPQSYRVNPDDATLPAGFDTATTSDPIAINLGAGGDDLTADFGYWNPGTIGDLVFNDLDNSGTRDEGEPGIPTVAVELTSAGPDGVFGTMDDAATTTATDANGNYLFSSLGPDDYRVAVDAATLPSGIDTLTTPATVTITLPAGDDDLTADFGYWSPGSIGDLVFNDLDSSGTRDIGEPGIAGVAINLTAAGPDGLHGTGDDIAFPSQITDPSGTYAFPGLPPEDYRVNVDNTSLPPGIDIATTTEPLDLTLAAGDERLDADFGFASAGPGPGSIGDLVWNDLNANGTRDPGEPGIPGVDVDLTGSGNDGLFGTSDDLIMTTDTDGGGSYLFTGLGADTYEVSVHLDTLPAAVDIATTPTTMAVVLSAGGTHLLADFGFWNPGSLGDLVWNDLNGDGLQDPGEGGLGAVVVDLLEAGPDAILGTADDIAHAPAVTAPDGSYAFTSLRPGNYEVSIDIASVPPEYEVVTTPSMLAIALAPGEDKTDADFGLLDPPDPLVSIEGTVWFDMDADGTGVTSGEPGLPAVNVQLWDVDGLLVAEALTDSVGYYLFANLAPGSYEITIDPASIPAGLYIVTYDPSGARDLSGTVVASVGDPRPIADFGLAGTGSIGDTVWYDANRNAVQDPMVSGEMEPGIAGVGLTARWLGYDGALGGGDDVVFPVAMTDADGHYLFTNLPAGAYVIEASDAPGYTLDGNAVLSLELTASVNGADVALYADFPFVQAETLPRTGMSSDEIALVAMALLFSGGLLLLLSRRREDNR